MLNQIHTTYGTQGVVAGPATNSLFPTSTYDDNVVWDDTKVWIDIPAGAPVYGRKPI